MPETKFYVKRVKQDGEPGYVGPLTDFHAQRELAAWRDCGYEAEMVEATPETRKAVNALYRSRRAARR